MYLRPRTSCPLSDIDDVSSSWAAIQFIPKISNAGLDVAASVGDHAQGLARSPPERSFGSYFRPDCYRR